jgi:hypothetical protein
MVVFAWGYAPAVHIDDGARMPASIQAIRRLDPTNESLVAASVSVYDANLGTIHRVRDIRSYDVLQEHGRIEAMVSMGFDRNSRAFPAMLTAEATTALAGEGVRFFLSRYPPPSAQLVAGLPSPAVGVYELPGAIPVPVPANLPPVGLLVGLLISVAALAVALALVLLVPHRGSAEELKIETRA